MRDNNKNIFLTLIYFLSKIEICDIIPNSYLKKFLFAEIFIFFINFLKEEEEAIWILIKKIKNIYENGLVVGRRKERHVAQKKQKKGEMCNAFKKKTTKQKKRNVHYFKL